MKLGSVCGGHNYWWSEVGGDGMVSLERPEMSGEPMMNFKARRNEPKFLVPMGMMCLVVAVLLQLFVNPSSAEGTRMVHFGSGMFYGLSLVFNFAGAISSGRQRGSDAG